MYHEKTPSTVFIKRYMRQESTWDSFEIQIANNVAENFSYNFLIYKIFSYLLSFANFSSTKFMSAFASFWNTKYLQCFVLQWPK